MKLSPERIVLYFILLSFAGWIYESIYCTIKDKQWQNRGVLFGPVCPIYGTGAGLALLLFNGRIGGQETALLENASPIAIFFICAVGSAVIEYITSFTLEKLFHARWWDYSAAPFNIRGRICLPATCGFGLAGVGFVRFVFPWLEAHLPGLESRFSLSDTAIAVLALLLLAVFSADLALTLDNLTALTKRLAGLEESFNALMEAKYAPIGEKQQELSAYRARLQDHTTQKIRASVTGLSTRQQATIAKWKSYHPEGTEEKFTTAKERLRLMKKHLLRGKE